MTYKKTSVLAPSVTRVTASADTGQEGIIDDLNTAPDPGNIIIIICFFSPFL